MADDHAPRMSNQDYFRCLDQAATATRAEQVQGLRTEVMRRWRGDPRADDLVEALYAHQERLATRENTLRLEAGRILSRPELRRGQLPA